MSEYLIDGFWQVSKKENIKQRNEIRRLTMLAEIRSKRIVAYLVLLGIAGAIGNAPKKAAATIGGQFVQLNQYDYSGQECESTKTILVDMETDDEGKIYAIYRRVIFTADCSAVMINPPGLLVKYDPELNELWSVEIDHGRPLALVLTDNYVWVLSYAVPLAIGGGQCEYAVTRVPRVGGLARTECIISGLSPFPGGTTSDGLCDLCDITCGVSDTVYACGSETVGGIECPWIGRIEFLPGGGFNVLSQRTFPEYSGTCFMKIAVDGGTVASLTSHFDPGGQNVLFADSEVGFEKRVYCPLGDDMQANDIDLSESAGCAVVAGYIENGLHGGTDACVVAVDLISGKIDSFVFGTEADEKLTGGKVYGRLHVKGKILVHGNSVLYAEGQSTRGLIVECEVAFDGTIKLLDAAHLGDEGVDVALYGAAFGGGGQYGFLYVGGTASGSFQGGEHPTNAAETSFIGIMDLRNPVQMIEALIAKVESMNLHQGIDNSLDVKLENAMQSLESVNAGNRQDAVNKLQAFINECVAQAGQKLTLEQADELIGDTLVIIDALQQ